MKDIKPIYIKLLIAAAVVFVLGVSMALSDLYQKVGTLEFDAMHAQGKCAIRH